MPTKSIAALPPVPPQLKSISPYLQRAREVEKAEPVIAYWCAFHAAQTCLSMRPSDNENRPFLMDLLEYLEQTKASLSDQDAITNNLAARAYVENFALKIFEGADREDLSGNSTKTTAQRFFAAACFLEVVQSLTNQPESEILEKIKYSKWKASSIVKALREGPTVATSAVPSEAIVSAGSSSSYSLNPAQTPFNPFSSSASTLPPIGPSTPDPWPTTELAPHSSSELPSPPCPSTPLSATHAPFPSTVFPPVYDSRHHLPSVPLAGEPIPSVPDLDPSRLAIEPVIGVAPRHFPALPSQPPTTSHNLISPPPRPHDARTGAGPPSMSHTFPPPLPPPLPSHPTHLLPAPTDSRPSAPPSVMMDPRTIEEVQKHAKWAISALNYEDLVTARKELLAALDKLSLLG